MISIQYIEKELSNLFYNKEVLLYKILNQFKIIWVRGFKDSFYVPPPYWEGALLNIETTDISKFFLLVSDPEQFLIDIKRYLQLEIYI